MTLSVLSQLLLLSQQTEHVNGMLSAGNMHLKTTTKRLLFEIGSPNSVRPTEADRLPCR